MTTEVFHEAFARAETNLRALELMSRYLNFFPHAVREEDVLSLSRSAGLSRDRAFGMLAAAYCGLNGDEHPEDREIEEKYFAGAIHCMDDSGCSEDPYYQNVRLPELRLGDWELGYKTLAPYECFPSDDPLFLPHGVEIPQAGYFTKAFRAPVVRQAGREWMTVTPSERNTMLPHVEKAWGRVAVFGLGLGYYPYMISRKDNVEEITIVERDASVIALFEEKLLPQFPHREKLHVVKRDAFEFAASMTGYDCAYVDLWHDVSDGAEMYLKMKRLEARSPGTEFFYWIEPSILAFIRSLMLYDLKTGKELPCAGGAENSAELWEALSNARLSSIADQIPLDLVRK